MHQHEDQSCFEYCSATVPVISALSKEEFMTGQGVGWALAIHFHCENDCPEPNSDILFNKIKYFYFLQCYKE